MKFRSSILLLLLIYLTSCSIINKYSFGVVEIGAWGPIELNSETSADQFFFSLIESPEVTIKTEILEKNGKLHIFPAEALIAGKTYQLVSEGKIKPVIKNIQIREACIVYVALSEESSSLWKKCPNTEPYRITNPDDTIEDFTVSPAGDSVFFTIKNDINGNEIWQVGPDGSGSKKVIDCGESKCSELGLDLFSSKLVFKQQSKKPLFKLLDLQTGNVSNIEGSGSALSLSPNGQFLSYVDDVTGQLTIINLDSNQIITANSGEGLMGEWARDSHSLIFGEMEFWGGIPGVIVNEMEIPSGKIKPILIDPTQELEFYQPRYTHDEGIYFASVRMRSTGASRQFWLLREGAEEIRQITTDPLFHFSLPSWSPDYSELVFQRFPINKSDGSPQVVVWNQGSDTFRVIAENASRPVWLP